MGRPDSVERGGCCGAGGVIVPPALLRVLLCLWAAASVGTASAQDAADAAEAGGRPNIVMIIADDQAWTDFGFMRETVAEVDGLPSDFPRPRTPHLDRLAEQSALFTGGYNPTSVCRPSLATLLTGLYPHQHGIHFNHPPPGYRGLQALGLEDYLHRRRRAHYLSRRVATVPRLLSEAGYRTLQTGKHWEGHYRHAGFTDGMTRGRPAAIEDELGLQPAHGNGDAGLTIGRRTMEPIFTFIDEAEAAEEPFFVWYAPYLPHTPHNAPQQYVERYADDPEVPDHLVPYFASCTWFDATVGRLIERLDERGLSERTLFVFVSDNGWRPDPERKGHRVDRRTKRSPFDRGLRTAILLRWDGRIRPGRHDELLSTVDLAPTILRAAGLSAAAERLPGHNLWPVLRGAREMKKRPVFGDVYPGDAHRLGAPAEHVAYRWVRRGPWKLIVPHSRGNGRPWRGYLDGPALFNVVDDPTERHDLSDDHPDRLDAMRRQLDAWWDAQTDPVPPPPTPLPEE